MVCKFANNGCELYSKEANAKTCEVHNGGPFMIHFFDGEPRTWAYCGKYRELDNKIVSVET